MISEPLRLSSRHGRALAAWLWCFCIAAAVAVSSHAQEDNDISNEYRVTIFPHHPIKDNLSGFGYLGYVNNPDKDYSLYYLGYPGLNYKVSDWLQVQTGLLGIYTDNEHSSDKFELRPFFGPKLFLPNSWKWNIYNFTRYEYRDTLTLDTDTWSDTHRLRSRFGVEFPLARGERAWTPKTWYGMADVEPFYRFDRETIDPFRVRGGIAYILNERIRLEFSYAAQFTRPGGGALEYTDNIFRLNVKVGLARGLVQRLFDGGDADD